MIIRSPKTKNEFKQYYDLRWKLLRKPWKQPKRSEKDELENQSSHIMVLEDNSIIGVGRIHLNSSKEAQVRYMAVKKGLQGKGIGLKILQRLEKIAKQKNAKYVILNARESAIGFYEKQGYSVIDKAHTLFGSISHFKMRKRLNINK